MIRVVSSIRWPKLGAPSQREATVGWRVAELATDLESLRLHEHLVDLVVCHDRVRPAAVRGSSRPPGPAPASRRGRQSVPSCRPRSGATWRSRRKPGSLLTWGTTVDCSIASASSTRPLAIITVATTACMGPLLPETGPQDPRRRRCGHYEAKGSGTGPAFRSVGGIQLLLAGAPARKAKLALLLSSLEANAIRLDWSTCSIWTGCPGASSNLGGA